MPTAQVLWRHLLIASRAGQRRWPSVTALARELEMPIASAHRCLGHPVEIGAVSVHAAGGLQVLDPPRLLMLLAAHRHLCRDVYRQRWIRLPAVDVEAAVRSPSAVLGAFGAVIAHLGGVNRIADYDTVLFYGEPELPPLPEGPEGSGTQVLIAEPDARLARYGRVTPFAHAYADLFAMPGWQASRFVDSLDPRQVAQHEQPVLLV